MQARAQNAAYHKKTSINHTTNEEDVPREPNLTAFSFSSLFSRVSVNSNTSNMETSTQKTPTQTTHSSDSTSDFSSFL